MQTEVFMPNGDTVCTKTTNKNKTVYTHSKTGEAESHQKTAALTGPRADWRQVHEVLLCVNAQDGLQARPRVGLDAFRRVDGRAL